MLSVPIYLAFEHLRKLCFSLWLAHLRRLLKYLNFRSTFSPNVPNGHLLSLKSISFGLFNNLYEPVVFTAILLTSFTYRTVGTRSSNPPNNQLLIKKFIFHPIKFSNLLLNYIKKNSLNSQSFKKIHVF